MLAALECPARRAEEPPTARQEAVGPDRISCRGCDVPAVVVHEVDLALHAAQRRREAGEGERPCPRARRRRCLVAAEARDRAEELGAELLPVVRRPDLGDAALEVAPDRRVWIGGRPAPREDDDGDERGAAGHWPVASASAASIQVLAAANASGSLDFTTTSTWGPSSPKVGYEPTRTPGWRSPIASRTPTIVLSRVR